mmetsp:Transcript_39338/g.57878  ORF Transcript_39338/g.57878 Transcript_39338/m.57878 type:complete len:103 (+) Transcript_39338:1754-2062(+)
MVHPPLSSITMRWMRGLLGGGVEAEGTTTMGFAARLALPSLFPVLVLEVDDFRGALCFLPILLLDDALDVLVLDDFDFFEGAIVHVCFFQNKCLRRKRLGYK